jgi:hypothetical protein
MARFATKRQKILSSCGSKTAVASVTDYRYDLLQQILPDYIKWRTIFDDRKIIEQLNKLPTPGTDKKTTLRFSTPVCCALPAIRKATASRPH